MKIYKITTKSHWGGHVKSWEGSECEHIEWASDKCGKTGKHLEGYSEHGGDETDAEYPRFDFDENGDYTQVSGAREASFGDAVAWFGHDVQWVKVEEIGVN